MTDTPTIQLNLPFDGKIKRSLAQGFKPKNQVKVARSGAGQAIEFKVAVQGPNPTVPEPLPLGATRAVHLEALVVDLDTSQRIQVSFRHPLVPKQMINVIVRRQAGQDPGPDGEVDGVWVAEEGGDRPPLS